MVMVNSYLILLPIFLKLAPSLHTAIPFSKHSSVTLQKNKNKQQLAYSTKSTTVNLQRQHNEKERKIPSQVV